MRTVFLYSPVRCSAFDKLRLRLRLRLRLLPRKPGQHTPTLQGSQRGPDPVSTASAAPNPSAGRIWGVGAA